MTMTGGNQRRRDDAVPEAPRITGLVFDAAESVLAASPGYRAFRAGTAGRADYCRLVDARARDLEAIGVPKTDVPFMKRFPRHPRALVGRILDDLRRRGILSSCEYDADLLDRTERAMPQYVHGPFKTYIYPEEGLLLGALANICAPKQAVFLGSFYGYWAHWAIPSIVAGGGRVWLVDPDEKCCDVASRNLRDNGLFRDVEVVASRGETFLAENPHSFDFVVLDAENPRDHHDPDQRGKRVYHSLTRAVIPRLSPGALFACHNILFTDVTGDPAFASVIARNRNELRPFAELISAAFGTMIEYRTTEGVGIGRYTGRPHRGGPWPVAADLDAGIDE